VQADSTVGTSPTRASPATLAKSTIGNVELVGLSPPTNTKVDKAELAVDAEQA
jgi:hypothetical protein